MKKITLTQIYIIVFCIISGSSWALSSFEPGGGGASQPDPIVDPDGMIRVRLVLTVWGSGGEIKGRYSNVIMRYYIATKPDQLYTLPGMLISSDKSSEQYEFSILLGEHHAQGSIEYYFEVTLDGHKTKIPSKHEIFLP